ncbi:helix-turn-helix transcriptional regulator [bacterium]|nr:helix-turn-helix transcriptional regulator [bacterium]
MNIELVKLGQKIKFERIKRGLSQEQLAELANLSVHGMSNVETGKTDIKYTNLLKIAKVFDLKISELLDFNL